MAKLAAAVTEPCSRSMTVDMVEFLLFEIFGVLKIRNRYAATGRARV
jgi:hypothetical protein